MARTQGFFFWNVNFHTKTKDFHICQTNNNGEGDRGAKILIIETKTFSYYIKSVKKKTNINIVFKLWIN